MGLEISNFVNENFIEICELANKNWDNSFKTKSFEHFLLYSALELWEKQGTWEKIVICKDCQGTGRKLHRELENYHHNEYNYWYEPCKKCEGTGRLKEITKSYKLTERDIGLE